MWTRKSLIYVSKIWGTSWVLTPIVLFMIAVIIESFTSDDSLSKIILGKISVSNFNMIQFFLMVYAVSFVCSLPYWFLLWPLNSFIDRIKTDTKIKKVILTVSAIFLLHLLFFIVNRRSFLSFNGFPWYLSIVFGIWYFRMEPVLKQTENALDIDDHLIV